VSGPKTPRRLEDAVALLAREPDLMPIAGCTDLMVTPPARATRCLDLLRIDELRGIASEGAFVRIGATTTFAQIGASPLIQQRLPALAEAASMVGGWQIQNRATVGGNVVNASPAGDSLPVLLALGATVVIAGVDGQRQVPYDQFHVAYRKTALRPGELVAWLLVPTPDPDAVQFFRKVGTRAAQAISKVVVAMVTGRDGSRLVDVRLAAGSVAPTPVRLTRTEKLCEGEPADLQLAERAAVCARDEVQPIDDVRSTAEYRRWVLGQVVRRMLLSISPTRAA
jgi:CO/xanthine dehydrogenase FAD-binding subunit